MTEHEQEAPVSEGATRRKRGRLPSGFTTKVKAIHSPDGELEEAFAPQSVCLTLTDEIDISRGDMIASRAQAPGVTDQFRAHVLWMAPEAMLASRAR